MSKVPAYDYYNPSTWLVSADNQDAAVDGADGYVDQAEVAKTDDVFAKLDRAIAAADSRSREHEAEGKFYYPQRVSYDRADNAAPSLGDEDRYSTNREDVDARTHNAIGFGIEDAHTSPRIKPIAAAASASAPYVPFPPAVAGTSAGATSPSNSNSPSVSSFAKMLPYRTGSAKIFADEEFEDGMGADEWDSEDERQYWRFEEEEEQDNGRSPSPNENAEKSKNPTDVAYGSASDAIGYPGEYFSRSGTSAFAPPRQHSMHGRDSREGRSTDRERMTTTMTMERHLHNKARREAAIRRAKIEFMERGEFSMSRTNLSIGQQVKLSIEQVPIPKPPRSVGALGKEGCAAVWWEYDRASLPMDAWVSMWEIKRYRFDRDKVWRYKGSSVINMEHLVKLNRSTVMGLENDMQYRFSVIGTNSRGTGFESGQSEAVMVEAPLPPGWFRFYDEKQERFFYSNIKTRRSSWARPELDPYYLDESIVLMFDSTEVATLKELFSEEMSHFGRVTIAGFRRMMLELGEVLGVQRAIALFQNYVNQETVTVWKDFMFIVASIKKRNQIRDGRSHCLSLLNATCLCPCFFYSEVLSSRLNAWKLYALIGSDEYHEKQKIGNWQVEWSELAERNCYTNVLTNTQQWDTPEEVRFYLPKKMEEQLLQYFNEGDLQDFRIRFAHLDLNNSGAIDEVEFKLLLESMEIHLSDKHRRKLVKEIDINGNGTIEFHEFCYMMLSLHKSKMGISSVWDQIRILTNDKEKLQHVTEDLVAVVQYEAEHGVHDKSHNPHAHVRNSALLHLDKNDEIAEKGFNNRPGAADANVSPVKGSVPAGAAGQQQPSQSQSQQGETSKDGGGDKTAQQAFQAKQQPAPAEKPAAEPEMQRSKSASGGEAAASPLKNEKKDKTSATASASEETAQKDRAAMKYQRKREKEMGGGAPAVALKTHTMSSLSRFQHILRPKNPDEQSQLNEEEGETSSPQKKERMPFTGESYVDRVTRMREEKAAAEAAARSPTVPEVCGRLLYGLSIGLLVAIGKGIFNAQQVGNDFMDFSDSVVDFIACKRKAGPHGSHCMCGCRMILPEDVAYPSFITESKAEPLTWSYLCPCCPCCPCCDV